VRRASGRQLIVILVAAAVGFLIATTFFTPAPPRDEYIRGLEKLIEEAAEKEKVSARRHERELAQLNAVIADLRRDDSLHRTEIDSLKERLKMKCPEPAGEVSAD
jgi:hypothetical protein